MCGIFIVKHENNSKEYIKKFSKSLDDLHLRGPDQKNFVKKQNYLIGFTRLSINDIEEAKQPYESEDGRYTLVFNGEILNYKNLINYLQSKKVNLTKYTETEVIFKLYIMHKEKFLDFLKGFFSIVIIDHKSDKIFSCVDEFSIKPIFKNIKKFNCSTYSIFHKNKIISRKYWSPFKNYQSNFYPKRDYVNIISNKLDDVVNLWKTSDVKLSNTRSSGIDSNILNFYFKILKPKISSLKRTDIIK